MFIGLKTIFIVLKNEKFLQYKNIQEFKRCIRFKMINFIIYMQPQLHLSMY